MRQQKIQFRRAQRTLLSLAQHVPKQRYEDFFDQVYKPFQLFERDDVSLSKFMWHQI